MSAVGQGGGVEADTHSIHIRSRNCEGNIHIGTHLGGVAHLMHSVVSGAEVGLSAGIHAAVGGGADFAGQVFLAVAKLQLHIGNGEILSVGTGSQIFVDRCAKGTGPEAEGSGPVAGLIGEVAVVDVDHLSDGVGKLPVADIGDDFIAGGGDGIVERGISSLGIEGEVSAGFQHGGGGLLYAVDVDLGA